MKRAIAKRWVAALRSGKYKQGRGQLRNGNKFCCLGVLCDISKLSEWKPSKFGDFEKDGIYGYLDNDGVLPCKVREWSGIKEGVAAFCDGSLGNNSLAGLNDEGKRFSTIAKVIEEHWKEL